MKLRSQIAQKSGLVGAGIGLMLFALVGLLQASLIGGAIGLDIVRAVFNEPAGPSLLSRAIIGASMLSGVIVAGIVFVGVCSSAAWAIGWLLGFMVEPKAESQAIQEKSSTR